MTEEILAEALGKLLHANRGLTYLSVPSSMPDSAIQRLVQIANRYRDATDFAFHVTRHTGLPGSISPEWATRLRSRDDGSEADVLIVARDGEFKELKSLEAFRHLNPMSVPAGAAGVVEGELSLDVLSSCIAGVAAEALANSWELTLGGQELSQLAENLHRVLDYLSHAYRSFGNEDLNWKDAWWQHSKYLSDRLAPAIQKAKEKVRDTRPDWIAMAVHAAAGMPAPDYSHGAQYEPRRHGPEQFAARIRDRWSTGEDASLAVTDIERNAREADRVPPDTPHPLSSLPWMDELDELVASNIARHTILAVSMLGRARDGHLQAWLETSEADFFSDPSEEIDVSLWQLVGGQFVEAPLFKFVANPTYLLAGPPGGPSLQGGQLVLGSYFLKLSVPAHRVSPQNIQLAARPNALHAEIVTIAPTSDGGSWIELAFSLRVRSPGKWREDPFTFTIEPNLVVGPPIPFSKTLILYLVVPMPGHSNFYLAPVETRKLAKKLLKLPQRQYTLDPQSGQFHLEDSSLARECFVKDDLPRAELYLSGPQRPLLVNGVPHQQIDVDPVELGITRPGSAIPLADGMTISHGEKEGISLSIEEQSRRPFSPIISAASGTLPGTGETGQQKQNWLVDPRAFLEDNWLAGYYSADDANRTERIGVGQALMWIGEKLRDSSIFLDEQSGFHVVGDSSRGLRLPGSARDPALTSAFWQAFDELELGNHANLFNGLTSRWPSRLSLLDLESDKVRMYLQAYGELVHNAKEDEHLKYLLYPFSTFLVEPNFNTISGILLGPLHPIRLAWHWSLQQATADAVSRLSETGIDVVPLLRFVDGAAIPFCGPAARENAMMATLPLDPGPEELFATWSCLWKVQDINARNPPPALISGFRFPAGTASGLDRGGVAAAVNDYLRVYPFTSGLRLALDAAQARPRSRELDSAIVAELGNLLRGRASQLPGGISVVDSPKREGPLPSKDAILAKVVDAMDALDMDDENKLWQLPFEWKHGTNEHVDIRFLEDALSHTEIQAGDGTLGPSGAMPVYPITRLHLWEVHNRGGARASGFAPGLTDDHACELAPLPGIMGALEAWGGNMVTWCTIPPGRHLQDDRSNWIVAGNTNLDPRILSATLIDELGMDRVLWEWRPPYLPRRWKGSSLSVMQSHPYTVIAKLPSDFKDHIRRELASTLGTQDRRVLEDLFHVLGTRGVGMASLLSMGHQQSRGAIGFYLGFKLARCWAAQGAARGEIRIVLPLDPVNPILATLVPRSSGDDRRKADLLFISASPRAPSGFDITFSAVEIKLHANSRTATPHKFPASGNVLVEDALAQLATSANLLAAFTEVIQPEHPVILDAVLASLLTTGLSLSSHEPTDTARQIKLLAAVAHGHCSYHNGKGLLFWFERHGEGHDGKPFLVRKATSHEPVTKVFMDPAACHDSLSECSSSPVVIEFLAALDYQQDILPPHHDSGLDTNTRETPTHRDSRDADAAARNTTTNDNHVSPGNANSPDPGRQEPEHRLEKLSEAELKQKYDQIIDTLEEYRISVYKPPNVDHYTEGPASVMYRVKPAPGIHPQKVLSQHEVLKLMLELSAEQKIRMFIDEGHVVIDVPKRQEERYFVDATHLWETWHRPPSSLAAPLGIDQSKQIVEINFSSSNSPHLLLGGTTGSGKSEALNTILFGLTRHYSPEELRLLLVDPKGTEMTPFEGSPHLHGEIGWDDESAIEQLDLAVNEMQRRYDAFRSARKRSLPEYNDSVDEGSRLPWWLVILDEYADLTSDPDKKKAIEGLLQRLAQKARAAGIHVIIATQKPSANVISTVLRSNLPAQLALRVKSATESRVIMDQPGAEALNGMGDAFLNSEGKLTRLQCAIYKPA